MTETLSLCMVCGQDRFSTYMNLKDHFLSKESFTIMQCDSCGFKFINPRPDQEHIGKYYQSEEYISHDANKRDLLSSVYKTARRVAIQGKYKIVTKYSDGSSLFDYGCGTGEFAAFCKGQGMDVKALEPNPKAREFAMHSHQLDVVETISQVKPPVNGFDCITLWHVLEHIHDLNGTLEALGKLLAKNGTMIIAVPNPNSLDAVLYGPFWAAYDVPRHLYHFTRPVIETLMKKHRFSIIQILPQKMDSFYVSMLSEKYKNGKGNLARAFFNGLRSNFLAGNAQRGYSSEIFILKREKP